MAARKRKRFWNEGGYDAAPHPERLPEPRSRPLLGHSTSVHWNVTPLKPLDCGRCQWVKDGRPGEEIPEHTQSCPYRETGNDPNEG